MTIWHELKKEKPEQNKRVFISDGYYLAVSCLEISSPLPGETEPWNNWYGDGFGGYEWEWDFNPTHWAEIDIELPLKEKT